VKPDHREVQRKMKHSYRVGPATDLVLFNHRMKVVKNTLCRALYARSWVRKLDLFIEARNMMDNIVKREDIFKGER
jgi:hypothetical protein